MTVADDCTGVQRRPPLRGSYLSKGNQQDTNIVVVFHGSLQSASSHDIALLIVCTMSMDEETAQALRTWKDHRYRPTDLPLADAVDSLVLEESLIYARQSDTRKSDWVVSTSIVAVVLQPLDSCMLTHAGSADMSYGNHCAGDLRIRRSVCGRRPLRNREPCAPEGPGAARLG